MKMSCLVVDDEPYAVNLLSEYIGQLPYLELKHTCYNAIEALAYLKDHKVDLVLLDINMPQLSGMQLSALLPAGQLFIFTTAYSEFAVESYERNAADYLLKPITFDRFLKAVNKVIKPKENEGTKHSEDTIFLKTGRSLLQLKYADIFFIEGLKDYVVFYALDGKHIVYKRMKDLEENLPFQFSRVHNSYIINRQHIRRIEENLVYIGERQIPVSEKYRDNFLEKLSDRLL